jgi:hypothetical protein
MKERLANVLHKRFTENNTKTIKLLNKVEKDSHAENYLELRRRDKFCVLIWCQVVLTIELLKPFVGTIKAVVFQIFSLSTYSQYTFLIKRLN